MAIFTEETRLYEILIRVHPDGSWNSQYQTLTDVKKDGVSISSTLNDVAPLTEDNPQAYSVVQQLIGTTSAETLIVNQVLRQQLVQVLLRNEELEKILHNLESQTTV